MNKLPAKGNEGEIASAIHMEFIQNLAEWSNGDGIADVESYHRALFLNHYGKDIERFQQQRKTHEERLLHLESRLNGAHGRLAALDALIPVRLDGEPDVEPNAPWNPWDRAMFGAALIGIACLLVFGVLNVSFNLLESGIVTFLEHPVRAYFWAALLPVGALAVKVGWDFLQSRRKRNIYLWTCLSLGLAGVLVWIAAYASIYPALSKTTGEQIESLSVFDRSEPGGESMDGWTLGGAKQIDMAIVAAQAVAEIFLSAVLGMYMTGIYARHRPVRLAPNPLFTQLDDERRRLEEDVGRERAALAEAKGSENRLENQLAVFVSFARSLFQKEAALRRDQTHQKRRILDQITEQLKSQLDAVESSNGAGHSGSRPLPFRPRPDGAANPEM